MDPLCLQASLLLQAVTSCFQVIIVLAVGPANAVLCSDQQAADTASPCLHVKHSAIV